MMRKSLILGSVVTACVTGALLGLLAIGPNANGATTPKPRHITSTCATFDITGRPSTGMPWDEPITFCGIGIKAGTWTCPAKTPSLNPGSLLHCSKDI